MAAGKFERAERRPFEAQTWEPELRKALDLGPAVPLQRTSALDRVAEFPYSLVRVDRIYRTDRSGATAAAKVSSPKGASPSSSAEGSRHPLQDTASPGELLWENAMVADHVMVQVEAGVTKQRLQRALPPQAKIRDQISADGLYLVAVPGEGERSIERAVLALNQIKGVVKFAEPDFLMSGADTTTNDPLFTSSAADTTKQWYLSKIMAPRAWDVIKEPKTAGDAASTVVAVVDTGVDYTHPDLAPNMWTNPGEMPNNGLDDDGNGKIDDIRGWDFIGQNAVASVIVQDNDPMDDSGHGTHVAGIIGAVGNNAQGVSGVCWGVKLLPLRIIKKVGTGTYGTYSTALGALDYIRTLNRDGRQVAVANHSWGGSGYSLAMLNAINNPVAAPDPLPAGLTSSFTKDVNQFTVTGSSAELAKIRIGMTIAGTGIPAGTLVTIVNGSAITLSRYSTAARTNQACVFSNPVRPKPYGVVHVTAAGNSRANSDRIPTYPACLPSGFIISAGASDLTDNVALWAGTAGSNYGRLTVDLFAPGSGIWSTKLKLAADPSYGYESRNGTSMAAPQVAGAVALLRLWQPNLTELQARQVLIDQSDVVSVLKDKCLSGGRLNVARMVDKVYQPILVGSGGSTGGGSATIVGALQAAVSITGRLAASAGHALFIDQGEVWAWGDNTSGQLGNIKGPSTATPTKVEGLSEVTMVAAAYRNSYALKADGTTWVWGDSGFAMLGGASSGGATPHQIPSLTDVVWISVGGIDFAQHCLAVKADGTVWAWGENGSGQLGDNSTVRRTIPVQVIGVSNVVQAEAGADHSVALCADGTVYAWGKRTSATSNQIGDGAVSGNAGTAVLIPGITDVVAVEASESGSFFLKSDGTVWKSGVLLTVPASLPSNVPTQVPSLENVQVLAAGMNQMLAIDGDGQLFGWGDGLYGDLGTGSVASTLVPSPLQIPEVDDVIACCAGKGFSMVMDLDGRLWCSGTNQFGQIGIGQDPNKRLPIQIPTVSNVTAIGGGYFTSWARTGDGRFLMWGMVNYAAQGITPNQYFQFPTAYPDVASPVVEIAGSDGFGTSPFFIARCADGTAWSWGRGVFGVLGTGSVSNSQQPMQITSLQHIIGVSCGAQFAIAVDESGSVYGWGRNDSGILGDGTTINRSTPVLVSSLSGIFQISAGLSHSLALKADGTVWAWGTNTSGQLGDGTTTKHNTPQQVPGLNNIIQIAALSGENASFALAADGSLYGWGIGGYYFNPPYQVPPVSYSSPTLIYKPSQGTIIKFAVGGGNGHGWGMVLLSDHTVVDWGDTGFNYQLGRGGPGANPNVAGPVFGATGVIDIAMNGSGPFCFLKSDGTVWSFGSDRAVTGAIGLGQSWLERFTQVNGFGSASTTLSTVGTVATTDSWYYQNFSVTEFLDDTLVADSSDPDRDGISNVMEYALGLDPRQRNDSALPTPRVDLLASTAQSESVNSQIQLFSTPTVDLTSGKRYLALTVNRSDGIRQDIDYIVEVSDDLQNWRSGDPHTVTVLDTAETLEVYSATSLDDAPCQFMRLRIQRR